MAKDLKNKIKDAWISETPDFRERIIEACEKETQFPAPAPIAGTEKRKLSVLFRRFIAVAACAVTFGVGLVVGKILPQPVPAVNAETRVYLDVNPSLELSLDKNNTVLSCVAANEDAESILNGMHLEGVELKTALNAIVGSMYVNGYLTSNENSMLISVDTNDAKNTDGLLTYITDQVNEVFVHSEMECAIIAQSVSADSDLQRRAEEQGISVGKMHLLDKMVDRMDDLTQNDLSELATMSIKDLNLIYSTRPDGSDKPDDEVISGSASVNVATDGALNAVLTEIGKTADDVEEYRIYILPSKRGGKKAVYTVTLKLYGDGAAYKYEVDCQTGEVTAVSADIQPGKGDENPSKDDEREDGKNDGKDDGKNDGKDDNPRDDKEGNEDENPREDLDDKPQNGTDGNRP